MPERVVGFLEVTGIIWVSVFLLPALGAPESELIWFGVVLQIVAFLFFFVAPNLLAKMSIFLWINRGSTTKKIEKMFLNPDFEMEEKE